LGEKREGGGKGILLGLILSNAGSSGRSRFKKKVGKGRKLRTKTSWPHDRGKGYSSKKGKKKGQGQTTNKTILQARTEHPRG